MRKKERGFLIRSTTRRKAVDPNAPGMIASYEAVIVVESLAKACEEAIKECPTNQEIVALSVAEMPVFFPISSWEEGVKGNA